MNIYSVFVALLANSVLARYYPNPHANYNYNLDGVRNNQYANGRYPPASLSSNPRNGETSYRGSTKQYPDFNTNTPPYWYKNSDDTNNWYSNEPGIQKPNNFPSTGNKPSYLENDNPQPGDKCYLGDQRNIAPATQAPYPPCWYKQQDGAWACFDQVNGKCPWDGAKNPPNSGAGSNTCYAGNMKDKPITSNYPPCWYKQEDNTWACFDKYKGECPWEGALPPQTHSLLSSATTPEYTESPGILGAIRNFLLTFQ
ncbi:hypothetical protein CONCODRAFT_11110 [Conidiobolus coronatus NRRL 28638]|uniref:Uncharacterized protein n=1 Tax=Conidiobolus coronatus (strain ATCC 28846 / CBS 209.66 / NRRL 28638) TaxID=796925 RepID=A0A137NVU0_CONC2|nr:hypothetical protein CONCODRAFT_11110 [Conidiobolus coronatus NRRL 28638]|eukprot:KXN66940.1 hypothetical protein CONCODRAFT_11110 [Conidiobolus coronatus NRRL 28638]